MKKILIIISFALVGIGLTFGQTKAFVQPPRISLLSDVSIVPSWTDSVKTDTLYSFQLVGHAGKIANIKVTIVSGTLEKMMDAKYRVKINSNDKAMDLTFTKLDPMTKENTVLKHIVIPAKRK